MTQEEYNVSTSTSRTLYAKIKLLNFNLQTVEEISGVVLPSSSYTISSSSDIRRTCNISIIPDDGFSIEYGSKIWIDKYIKVYIGIEDVLTKEVVYTNMGIYLINNPSSIYSATDNTLSFEGVDLMAKLSGLRNGELQGLPHVISAGENVRTSIIQVLSLANITNYSVDECEYKTVPNEIYIDIGGTILDLLTQLKNIIPSYEMYFDVDGVFHYHKMPSGKNEQIFIDDDILQKLLIDYERNSDFSNLKNVIEVFGSTWELGSNYLGDATFSSNTYQVESVNEIEDGTCIGFTTKNSSSNPKITVTDKMYNVVVYTDETMAEIPVFDSDETYRVFKYVENTDGQNYYIYMGESTPYAYAEEDNTDSPFYINGTAGIIRTVLIGGDYDNITNIKLAQERANWELYTRCRIMDNISITCIPIYWLDVNKLCNITLPKIGNYDYIIKDISTTLDVSGTQNIVMMKYYPEFDTI